MIRAVGGWVVCVTNMAPFVRPAFGYRRVGPVRIARVWRWQVSFGRLDRM